MKHSLLLVALLHLLFTACLQGNALEKEEVSVPKRLLAEIGDAPDFAFVWNTKGDADLVAEKLTKYLQIMAETNPELGIPPLDLRPVMRALGFSSIHGIAASSTDIGGTYEMRSFMYAPNGLSGLMATMISQNSDFQVPDFAPADTHLALEFTMNLNVTRDAIRQSAIDIMGEDGGALIDGQLSQTVPGTELTWNALIDILSTRFIGYASFEYADNGIPTVDFLIKLDGAGHLLAQLETVIQSQPELTLAETDRGLLLSLPAVPDTKLSVVVLSHKEDGALYIGSSPARFESHFSGKQAKLKDDPEFQKHSDKLPKNGTAFSFVSPAYYQFYLKTIKTSTGNDPAAKVLDAVFTDYFSKFTKPQLSASVLVEDGLRGIAYSDQSLEDAMYIFPAGLIAAMAIPALEKVRETSQEKAIFNNLQMIAVAAESYFAETGETEVKVENLIGPDNYIEALNSVAGERYDHLVATPEGLLAVTTDDGRTFFFDMSTWEYWTAPGEYDPSYDEWEEWEEFPEEDEVEE